MSADFKRLAITPAEQASISDASIVKLDPPVAEGLLPRKGLDTITPQDVLSAVAGVTAARTAGAHS